MEKIRDDSLTKRLSEEAEYRKTWVQIMLYFQDLFQSDPVLHRIAFTL